jgi:type I restriction enzyme, S subunit
MSIEMKTNTTKEEARPALVPKLRFPEFRGLEEWNSKRLGDLFSDRQETGLTGLPLLSLLDREGIVPQENSNRKNNSNSDKSKYLRVVPGDIAYNTMRMWEGRSALVGLEGLVSPAYTVCKPQPSVHSLFFSYYFKTPQLIEQFRRFSQGLVKDTLNLKYPAFAKISAQIPTYPEQQKIAQCLSSVVELMAAQARRVDALKRYKGGLVQQLFPRAGETQPRLRFPEFQNNGEWEVRTIGEMFNLINGCAFKPEDWKSTGTPIIRIQNLNDPTAEFNYSQAPVSERNRVESGDLLFAWSGTLGSSFGARIWNGPLGVLNQHIFKVLMDEQQIILQFALLVLERVEEDIARRTHGFKASFVHVKKSDLVQVELLLPSVPEQQRIASCLSSLDALITAETQKLEALKTHKKGLMQQLFPSPEAVVA